MERFHGNSGLAALVGIIGVAFFAIAIWVTGQVSPELAKASLLTLAEGIFLFFTFLGTGLLCLFAADSLGASYRLDDRGIARRSLLRAMMIEWSDLDHFDEMFSAETGTQYRYNLYAGDGRRIIIAMSCVAGSDRLRNRLEPGVALASEPCRCWPSSVEAGPPTGRRGWSCSVSSPHCS